MTYEPATIHDEMSPCVTAPCTVQSANDPTGALTDTYATPRDRLSVVNSCCGLSNEPVVSRLNCPENGVLPNKFVASRAGAPKILLWPNAAGSGSSSASTDSGTIASLRIPRRAWRSRHATSLWLSLGSDPLVPLGVSSASIGSADPMPGPTPAASTGYPGAT